MPIYEFYCPDNHTIYSFYARSMAEGSKLPRCPANARYRMERLLSSFAVTGRKKEEAKTNPGGEMPDARMEAAMAEMERDMSGMDTENPDPRRLAAMMRKMSGLMGEKVPAQMEEMLARMERGEDPEKLEEEYGDAIDGMNPAGDAPAGEENSATSFLRRRRKPSRDAVLYEMREFVG